jgi:hypothetical protein
LEITVSWNNELTFKLKMKEIYSKQELETEVLECDNCGWKGKGSEARIVDFYGIAKVEEIHCPNCDAYLAGLLTETTNEE